MNYFKLILLLLFFVACKKETKSTIKTIENTDKTVIEEKEQKIKKETSNKQEWQKFSISDKEEDSKQQSKKEKLTEKQWRKFGFFNIEKFNSNFKYFITNKSKTLKIIERVYDSENIIWLCIVNDEGFYNDALEVAYDNAEGFLGVSSKMQKNTIIVNTYNEYETPQEKIDTLLIHNNTFRHPAKEKEVIGYWINEENDLKITIKEENNKLEYTFTSPKRTLTNNAFITHDDFIVFNGFKWSEYAGGAIDEENDQKFPEPPTSFSAILNSKEGLFEFQNYGNAMNYYTIIEEAASESKYVTFKKEIETKDSSLNKNVFNFIKNVKEENIETLANKVNYPLKREYPLPAIKNKEDFIENYPIIFDDYLKQEITNSISKDWSKMGWRGIMLKSGIIWLDENGFLIAINYSSKLEKEKKNQLIKTDRDQLHSSLQKYDTPEIIFETSKFRVRIDQIGNTYRYASWSINSKMSEKPDLILKNGKVIMDGSGGNHHYVFNNNNFRYECHIIKLGTKDSPLGLLLVYNNDKEIINQTINKIVN